MAKDEFEGEMGEVEVRGKGRRTRSRGGAPNRPGACLDRGDRPIGVEGSGEVECLVAGVGDGELGGKAIAKQRDGVLGLKVVRPHREGVVVLAELQHHLVARLRDDVPVEVASKAVLLHGTRPELREAEGNATRDRL